MSQLHFPKVGNRHTMLYLVLCGCRESSLYMGTLLTEPSLGLLHHYLLVLLRMGWMHLGLLGLQSQDPTLIALQTYLTLWGYH